MLSEFRADLHVHTCLSPCASEAMLPRAIVSAAVERQLDLIAVSDHNATENVRAIRDAAEGEALTVLGGVEITSREEVHILGLFDCDDALAEIGSLISEHLPGRNDVAAFGEQWVVAEDGSRLGCSDRLLIGATSLSVEAVVAAIHGLAGLAIASHIDREAFGIIGQLGLIPPGLELDALEISSRARTEREDFTRQYDLPVVTASDAHALEQIGSCVTIFKMAAGSVAEMRRALHGEDGRKVVME